MLFVEGNYLRLVEIQFRLKLRRFNLFKDFHGASLIFFQVKKAFFCFEVFSFNLLTYLVECVAKGPAWFRQLQIKGRKNPLQTVCVNPLTNKNSMWCSIKS